MRTHFDEMAIAGPDLGELSTQYKKIEEAIESSQDTDTIVDAIRQWDGLRRQFYTYSSLTRLRFRQDTKNAEYKARNEALEEMAPDFVELEVKVKNRLLDSKLRTDIEKAIGPHIFKLWQCDVTSFEPSIQDKMREESKLTSEYTELIASAAIDVEGETVNLSQIGKFTSHQDRNVRYRAEKAKWGWLEEKGPELDRIFDRLVGLRHEMAQELGYADYVGLGYELRQRVDYNRDDVETFRAEVREKLVPLTVEIRKRQAARLDVDPLMAWDAPVFDPKGNPKPVGSYEDQIEAAQAMFDGMHPEMGSFFQGMNERGLLDLRAREGKASGGFCTWFPEYETPFIFANFNGTKGDVEVFTHEMGHAFQCWMSRGHFPVDLVWPTFEACEIHSMSLEFLCWPHMEKLFGAEEAQRFRSIHLAESILFIPYGVAVDHFQHLIYENPDATPMQRLGMWQQMEELYLPWLNWGDLARPAQGARWQVQSHIFQVPFYYIDYTLAMTCALQFWVRMQEDYDQALVDYVELCKEGGKAPFQELARFAGLTSPFVPGSLSAVVDRARSYLDI